MLIPVGEIYRRLVQNSNQVPFQPLVAWRTQSRYYALLVATHYPIDDRIMWLFPKYPRDTLADR